MKFNDVLLFCVLMTPIGISAMNQPDPPKMKGSGFVLPGLGNEHGYYWNARMKNFEIKIFKETDHEVLCTYIGNSFVLLQADEYLSPTQEGVRKHWYNDTLDLHWNPDDLPCLRKAHEDKGWIIYYPVIHPESLIAELRRRYE